MKTKDILMFVALGTLLVPLFPIGRAAQAEETVQKTTWPGGQAIALLASGSIPGQLNYQGCLVNAADSSAVSAVLEMTFRLFDSETKGAELWSETHSLVDIDNGLFQVLLGSVTPFPIGLFDGAPLWLQTEVGPEVLSPRKLLVSVAYSQRSENADHASTAEWATQTQHAVHADTADVSQRSENADHASTAEWAIETQHAVHADTADVSLSTGGWTVSGDDVYRETGRVGIGTASPMSELDVSGAVNATTYYGDGSNLTGISGTADDDWTISGDDIYHLNGHVGIGTTSPSARLDVREVSSDVSVNVHGQDDGKSSYDLLEGAAYFRYDEAEAEVRLWNAVTGGNAGHVSLGTSNSERLRISKEGQVGIGTTAPAHKLDVNGDVGATTYYGDGSHLTGITAAPDGDWTISGNDLHCAVPGSVSIGAMPIYGKLAVYNPDGRAILGEDGSSGCYGYVASYGYGLYGSSQSGYGVGGNSTYGTGVWGSSTQNPGVYGNSEDSIGVYGYSLTDYGVYGFSNGSRGVYGEHSGGNYGYLGGSSYGVLGHSTSATGVRGTSTSSYGVYAYSNSGTGVHGYSASYRGVCGYSPSGYAGYFDGDVHIDGTLTGGKGATVIDHPLDPERKLLRQNFVESPENLWICRGRARLDAAGEAIVHMPDYFAALTREDEATVSLTPVGKPFLTGYQWQSNGASFMVFGQPDGEVSWVVYADRDDAVTRQLTRSVVEEKGPENKLCDQGELLYPQAYGYPESRGANYEEREKINKMAEE